MKASFIVLSVIIICSTCNIKEGQTTSEFEVKKETKEIKRQFPLAHAN